MKSFKILALFATLMLAAPLSSEAAVLTNTWTYAGGAFKPSTYGSGVYRPVPLIPDTAASNGATIVVGGMTSGGLGSGSFPSGYGGYYTFFSEEVEFTLQTSTVLSGLQTITVSFLAGGGETFGASALTLNYNPTHTSLTTLNYVTAPGGSVSTPIGTQNLTSYTWTWNVSSLGTSSAFSIDWKNVPPHEFYAQINMVQQSIPEPSSFALIGVGLGALWVSRKRSRKTLTPSI